MSSLIDENTQYVNDGGLPIVNGFIHIGSQNTDPTSAPNKITIYSDRDLTTTLANPQRTDADGRSVNKVWIPGRYSITVQDSDSVQEFSDLDAGESPATGISNLTNVAGANTITADAAPTVSALTDKEIYVFTSIGTNTGAVTLAIDLVAAKAVLKYHDQPLVAGDIEINQVVSVMYNSTDDAFELVSSTAAGASFPQTVKFSKGADIASATALTLGADGNYFDVTGTTAITSIGTVGIGTVIKLHFDAILTLTHHATDLVLPGGANITTAAGDEAEVIEYASGDWRLSNYQRDDGRNLGTESQTVITLTSSQTESFTSIPPWVKRISLMFDGVSVGGAATITLSLGDAGGIETTGYLGCASVGATVSVSTTVFRILPTLAASDTVCGSVLLTRMIASTNTWALQGNLFTVAAAAVAVSAGSKSLSGVLTQLQIAVSGGQGFDAGSINIMWE